MDEVNATSARVAGSPASLECRLHSTVDLGESTIVLGDVVALDRPQRPRTAPAADGDVAASPRAVLPPRESKVDPAG